MKASDDRILTTHVGSLPRSPELLRMLEEIERDGDVNRDAFESKVVADLEQVVRNQLDVGIDVGGDGELPRIGFSSYVKDRVAGFGGVSTRGGMTDYEKFPRWAEMMVGDSAVGGEQPSESSTTYALPMAQEKIRYDPDRAAAKEELAWFAGALDAAPARFAETFVTAASPGIISTTLLRSEDNAAYANDREYLADICAEMRAEYELIVERGHVLQIDAPDLAFERQIMFRDRPLSEFLERVRLHVEVLNEAISNIPRDRVRMHVCWGNWNGPHIDDVELEPLLPYLYEAQVAGISMAGANPLHAHDFKLFASYPLPEHMVLLPGVIDVTHNYLEHPEVVADRICAYADVVGDPSRIIASTDCGFGTFAGLQLVAEDVTWKKLERLAEGAQIASERLGK
ncbi:cobalamin-independent methionine synthase II family protein [Conexibacter woesei]|uniref:Methionine synthase vitamin-B12 independent n=1 Tax=Conexibacter woesei (strain DSM 14684 / CCUG 47730 / CIP 108061 / JCM 11494 / NBRC 100937 / ID131577) TaxID=469383 RepID=D3F709_CONWI|nr:cobalamin-independent methionine synthase II family protein [Conexibacter woesei]ADB52807.1 Methionine synthase vitamin-B12 independent [Conexibacter woesei DSM 14684]